MRTGSALVSVFAIGAWLVACGDGAGDSPASPDGGLQPATAGPSVSAGVEFDLDGNVAQLTVSASVRGGAVRGRWRLKHVFYEGAHGDVFCFTIAPDGKTAWVGGLIDGVAPGDAGVVFTVQDNGEGDGSPPDQASVVSGVAWQTVLDQCELGLAVANLPVTDGNVQVRP